jgi:hypothetical protein
MEWWKKNALEQGLRRCKHPFDSTRLIPFSQPVEDFGVPNA